MPYCAPGPADTPCRRGAPPRRFKIIEEDGPSRGSVSKAPSSADLRVRTDAGRASLAASGGLLPRLQELAEAATLQAVGLQKLIDAVARDLGNSAGPASAATTPAAAAGADGALGATFRAYAKSASLRERPTKDFDGGEARGGADGLRSMSLPPAGPSAGLSRTASGLGSRQSPPPPTPLPPLHQF